MPAPPHRLALRLSRSSSWRPGAPPGSYLRCGTNHGLLRCPGKVRVSAFELGRRADVCKASSGACKYNSSSGRTQDRVGEREAREPVKKVEEVHRPQETGYVPVCPRIAKLTARLRQSSRSIQRLHDLVSRVTYSCNKSPSYSARETEVSKSEDGTPRGPILDMFSALPRGGWGGGLGLR